MTSLKNKILKVLSLQNFFIRFSYLVLCFLPFSVIAQVDDTLSLSLNDFVIVDSIEISGNEITKPHIILRELTFNVGDSVNSQILQFNRERVYSIGIFNHVKLYPIERNGKNIIVISLMESWYIYPIPFMNINGGAINRVSYGLRLLWKNFRGRDETIDVVGALGYDPYLIISFYTPLLIEGANISMKTFFSFQDISNKSKEAENLYGDEFSYKFFGGGCIFGKRLNNFNTVSTILGYQYYQVEDHTANLITINNDGIDRMPYAGIAYIFDNRDLTHYATNGIYASAEFIHKGFGVQNIKHNIYNLDFRNYNSIFNDIIAKWRIVYRHTSGTVPYYDQSYLGFSEYVRGHRRDERGGHNAILFMSELSIPIIKEWDFSFDFPIIPTKLTSGRFAFHVTAFADVGITYNNNEKLALNNAYAGYGIGVIFLVLPYNALRLEYAFNEKGKPEFLFSSGFSF